MRAAAHVHPIASRSMGTCIVCLEICLRLLLLTHRYSRGQPHRCAQHRLVKATRQGVWRAVIGYSRLRLGGINSTRVVVVPPSPSRPRSLPLASAFRGAAAISDAVAGNALVAAGWRR